MTPQQIREISTLDRRIAQAQGLKRIIKSATYARIASAVSALPGLAWAPEPSMEYGGVKFYLYLYDMTTFADPVLNNALMTLASKALRLTPDSMKEAPDEYLRRYYFKTAAVGSTGLPIIVCLTATERQETASCQKVQVGTKMVETPIYEMKCLDVIATEVPPPSLVGMDNLL